jgi:transcriptional regulator with XRE-family HTH domain
MKQTFGDIIKSNRLAKSLTLKQLKGQISMWVSEAYLTNIENQGEIPTPKLMRLLALALELDYKTIAQIAINEKVAALKSKLEKSYL